MRREFEGFRPLLKWSNYSHPTAAFRLKKFISWSVIAQVGKTSQSMIPDADALPRMKIDSPNPQSALFLYVLDTR